jgi:hypothetical protein
VEWNNPLDQLVRAQLLPVLQQRALYQQVQLAEHIQVQVLARQRLVVL